MRPMITQSQRMYETVSYLIIILANIMEVKPEVIIDALIGVLWDEEEASDIKRANV